MQKINHSILLIGMSCVLMVATIEASPMSKWFGKKSGNSELMDLEVKEMERLARRKDRTLEKYAEYEELTNQSPEENENQAKAAKPKSDPNREFFKGLELNEQQNEILDDYKIHVKSMTMPSLSPSETLINLMSYIGTKNRLKLSLDEGLTFDRPSFYTYIAISRLNEAKLKSYIDSAGIEESDLVDSCRKYLKQRSEYTYNLKEPSSLKKPEMHVEQIISLAKANVPASLLAYEALLANMDVFISESFSKICMLTEAKDIASGDLEILF